MLIERTDGASFYDILAENGAGLFFQPRRPHGAIEICPWFLSYIKHEKK